MFIQRYPFPLPNTSRNYLKFEEISYRYELTYLFLGMFVSNPQLIISFQIPYAAKSIPYLSELPAAKLCG